MLNPNAVGSLSQVGNPTREQAQCPLPDTVQQRESIMRTRARYPWLRIDVKEREAGFD